MGESRLVKETPFLSFLATTSSREQFDCILDTITQRQGKIICEIFFNLRHGKLSNSERILRKFKKNKQVIELLKELGTPTGKNNLTIRERIPKIKRNKDVVWFVLNRTLGPQISQLLTDIHNERNQ